MRRSDGERGRLVVRTGGEGCIRSAFCGRVSKAKVTKHAITGKTMVP